jgi:hypothetical protein
LVVARAAEGKSFANLARRSQARQGVC